MKAIQNWFVKDRVQAIKGEVAKDEVSNFLILAEMIWFFRSTMRNAIVMISAARSEKWKINKKK